ncbi:hypothetical protein, partial [Achromobacter xylosoxidans]|uniref:hypothetical protein n=1 Tax=Alcaligenes xylosoxydans xylosoxydans TaxID=85698 RepID=UPI001C532E31
TLRTAIVGASRHAARADGRPTKHNGSSSYNSPKKRAKKKRRPKAPPFKKNQQSAITAYPSA